MSVDLSRLREILATENELRAKLASALTPATIVAHQQEWVASWAACQQGVIDLRIALEVAADLAEQIARQLRAHAQELPTPRDDDAGWIDQLRKLSWLHRDDSLNVILERLEGLRPAVKEELATTLSPVRQDDRPPSPEPHEPSTGPRIADRPSAQKPAPNTQEGGPSGAGEKVHGSRSTQDSGDRGGLTTREHAGRTPGASGRSKIDEAIEAIRPQPPGTSGIADLRPPAADHTPGLPLAPAAHASTATPIGLSPAHTPTTDPQSAHTGTPPRATPSDVATPELPGADGTITFESALSGAVNSAEPTMVDRTPDSMSGATLAQAASSPTVAPTSAMTLVDAAEGAPLYVERPLTETDVSADVDVASRDEPAETAASSERHATLTPESTASATERDLPAGPTEPIAQVADLAIQWLGNRETLPRAYLAATWLRAVTPDWELSPTLISAAYRAFDPTPGLSSTTAEADLLALGDPSRLSIDVQMAAWAVSAALVLSHGSVQALQYFLNGAWLDGASSTTRRAYDVITSFHHRYTEEPFALVLRRIGRRPDSTDDVRSARAAVQVALQSLLGHNPKFPLGKKIAAHARDELAWMSEELRDERVTEPSPRLAAWTRDLEAATLLDRWASTVDPGHRVGIISGARTMYIRDLDELGRRLRDWLALVPTADAISMNTGIGDRAARDLIREVREQGDVWIDGWGTRSSGAFGRLLIDWLRGLIAAYPDVELA